MIQEADSVSLWTAYICIYRVKSIQTIIRTLLESNITPPEHIQFFQKKEIVFQPLIFKHEKPLVSGSRVTTSGDLVYLKDEGYKFF